MKTISIFNLLVFFVGLSAHAQTIDHVSIGASYSNQSFYRLSDGNTQSSAHSTWHIAFSVFGGQDAGVFINEGASLSGSGVKLYATGLTDFNTTIDTNTTPLTNELSNQEISWENGAFNETRSSSNPFDYGWGIYSMTSHKVEGDEVFVLELPNGALKKIIIDSLAGGTYYFRYADLDGANAQSKSVQKSNFAGQTLAYFSLTTGNTVANIEPSNGWDLLFTRYEELIPDGQGAWMPYAVTGVLSNKGVAVAEAKNVNTSTVNYQNYLNQLSEDTLYTIGSDWKHYDFTNGWSVDANRAYFVKTADDILWKLVFIDFQGSGTGTSTLQKTNLGTISSIEINKETSVQFEAYPNPSSGPIDVVFDLGANYGQVDLTLQDLTGRVLFEQQLSELNGLKANNLLVTKKIQIQR